MKRIALWMLVIGALLMMVSPAGAKWVLMARNPNGNYYVSDRFVKVQGDCKTVVMGLIYKKPVMDRSLKKTILAKKYTIRFCCRAKTYQPLGYVLVDTRKKDFFGRRIKTPARPIKPGTVVASIARRVCAPGFGAKVAPTGPKPPAKAAKPAPTGAKPSAADSYKQTCKYCSNSGGIWLCCTCKTASGANKRSCLDPRKCQGRGISNCNGTLTCGKCK